MLLMWSPGAGELLVLCAILIVMIGPGLLVLVLLLRLLRSATRNTGNQQNLEQRVADLERRLEEKKH